jgi:hypothetical protein
MDFKLLRVLTQERVEGSGENHYFIARVGEVYYKVEYNYYSYQGLEFSKNDMIIVYPQQVMTTIFL